MQPHCRKRSRSRSTGFPRISALKFAVSMIAVRASPVAAAEDMAAARHSYPRAYIITSGHNAIGAAHNLANCFAMDAVRRDGERTLPLSEPADCSPTMFRLSFLVNKSRRVVHRLSFPRA